MFFRQIENCCQQELKNSEFLTNAIELLNQTLQNIEISEVICLGIGRISECSIARHQLAFILIAAKHFKITEIKFFDPVLTEAEKRVLEELGCQVLSDNKEGKYIVEHPTLFYLPHCPKQITNNLLFENWTIESLPSIFLICNSFQTIIETTPERFLRPNAHFILEINQFATEVEIENNFRFTDIFNDFSIHSFAPQNLQSAPQTLWDNKPVPTYKEEDLELIKNDGS